MEESYWLVRPVFLVLKHDIFTKCDKKFSALLKPQLFMFYFSVVCYVVSSVVINIQFFLFQVFFYIFAIVGMESFQGLVKFTGYDIEGGSDLFCSNAKLENSDFWRDHYCNNNFNDIIHAFIVLFELTVVNQWHDIL